MMEQNYDTLIQVIKNATNRIEEHAQKIFELQMQILSERLEGKINLLTTQMNEIHEILTNNGLIKSVDYLKEEVNSFKPITKTFWLIISTLTTGLIGLCAKVIFWNKN